MKKFVLSAVGAVALLATPALAADLRVAKAPPPPPPAPSAWDIAFGGALATDYNFRGISQSDRGPSVSAYFEPRFNINSNFQLYVGIAGASVRLPQTPSAEIDLYGGIRPTFGMLALDFGAIYYWYPHGQFIVYPNGNFSLANQSYWEVYGKATVTFNDYLSVGANAYFFNSWLNTGAQGSYLSVTAKVSVPAGAIGLYVSGEVGRLTLGNVRTITFPAPIGLVPGGLNLPDYTTWNLGVGGTWKVFTLDLRYYDTNLTRANCNLLTGDPGARGVPLGSRWCSSAFIGKLSFDTTVGALK